MTITEAARQASQCGGAITREEWDDLGVYCYVVLSNLAQRTILIKDTGDIIPEWSPQLDDICANDWLVLCQMFDSPYPYHRLSSTNNFDKKPRNCG